jgi:parallel beta-helix repeat protein
VEIRVSGQPGKPITFAAAPGQKVVVKGSDVVTGQWERVSGDPSAKEPYPNAFTSVWRIKLRDEYFAGMPPKERYIPSVFQDDTHSLQQIGEDRIYKNDQWQEINNIGRGLSDIYPKAYFFDQPTQTLYVCISGDPAWSLWEIGTRGFVFHLENVHDVVLRGFQVRHNRQPGGQWSMAGVGSSERVLVEGCDFSYSDFCGFSMGRCKNCTVRDCRFTDNGDTGVALGWCTDCKVQDCSVMFNNTRHFEEGWAAGGIKNIPENVRCSVDGCEVAYNHGPGVWFDTANVACRITGNVIHDNESNGIHYEINEGGGLIANNLVFSNGGRGIYISGSQNVRIVYNTVAKNN